MLIEKGMVVEVEVAVEIEEETETEEVEVGGDHLEEMAIEMPIEEGEVREGTIEEARDTIKEEALLQGGRHIEEEENLKAHLHHRDLVVVDPIPHLHHHLHLQEESVHLLLQVAEEAILLRVVEYSCL